MNTELTSQDLPVVASSDRPMSVQEIMNQSLTVHEVLTRVMVKDIHYGQIPGTDKPTLYQAGAEKICSTFRLAPKYEVEDLGEPHNNFYRYRVKCSLYTIHSGYFVGSAVGEASSAEEKYQWEKAVCQEHWDKTDPSRRREKFKKADNDDGFVRILQVQRNCADLANTVLKIAVKRSFTSTVKGATAASDILEVDLDEEPVADLHREEKKDLPKPKAKVKTRVLAYGKHKGTAIDNEVIPLDYLQWLVKSTKDNLGSDKRKAYEKDDRQLISDLEAEIAKREKQPQEPDKPKPHSMSDEEWVDFCSLAAEMEPLLYMKACEEFGVKDAGALPNDKRQAFQDRVKKLS
jgi:hypothetical protein